jgi:membrane associated rhomboid family serine protease
MGGLLVATVSFTLLVIVLVAVLVAVSVLPVYVAVQMAEARRFSTTRWFAAGAATVLIGLLGCYALHQHDLSRLLVVLPLVLTWAAPIGLWLLEPSQVRIGGRAGLHE